MIKLHRLSHRILAVLIVIIVVVMALSGFAMSMLARNIVSNSILNGQQNTAVSISETILNELGEKYQKLETLAVRLSLLSLDAPGATADLRSFQSQNPLITGLFLADTTGMQIARSDFNEPVDVSSVEGFNDALDGDVFFSDLAPVRLATGYSEAANGTITTMYQQGVKLTVFVPVVENGQVTGILGATVNLIRFQLMLEEMAYPHDEIVIVASRSLKVVAISDADQMDSLPYISPAVLRAELFVDSDTYNDEVYGKVKAIIQPVGNQDWTVFVLTPVSAMNQELGDLWILILLLTVAGIAIAVAAAWVLAGRLTRPLSDLAQAAGKVAGGDLDVSVKIDSDDEIGQLSSDFNRMVAELRYIEARNRALVEELEKLNEGLEKRVEDRTRELADQKDRADAANRAKTNFIANLSHELRTPLTSILGFSETLGENLFGEMNEKQSEYVRYIVENARHMQALIGEIVDLEKIEAGKIKPDLTAVQVQLPLGSALDSVQTMAETRHQTIRVDIPNEIGNIRVKADEAVFKTVLVNLLTNAVKFTPENGNIIVKAEIEAGFMKMSVVDNGIGIAAENLERIFEDFYQLRNVAGDKVPGLGLGLGLSRRLAELMGGRLWAESEGNGKGNRFIFTVPIHGEGK